MSAISLCNCTKSIQYATQGLFSVPIPISEGARKGTENLAKNDRHVGRLHVAAS